MMPELSLTGESFALVGEREAGPKCVGCGMVAFLVAGLCEPCINEHAQNLIEQEARQRVFFSEADCGGVLGADGCVYSDAEGGL